MLLNTSISSLCCLLSRTITSLPYWLDTINKRSHYGELLGKLEIACAILNFRTYMPITCIPEFKKERSAQKGPIIPLLTEAVMNDVDWQTNTLVTGSNASGKSTYVKSIAINCLLAQTIQTAVAESFTMEPGHVLTSMAVEDDLFEGR